MVSFSVTQLLHRLLLLSPLIINKPNFALESRTRIIVDTKNVVGNFKHFWKSTGLCPPDPKQEVYKFLLSDQEKLNLALIGALPNQGIKQVRVHWLLNLISVSNNTSSKYGMTFDFTHLDNFLRFLVNNNLKPGFELMGFPVGSHFDKTSAGYPGMKQTEHNNMLIPGLFWENLTFQTVSRYIGMFGAEEISSWRFETWNEPDLKNYNLLNFTLPEYSNYVMGSAEGLRKAFTNEAQKTSAYPELTGNKHNKGILGGPAGLFRKPENHPLCWGLLKACFKGTTSSNMLSEFIHNDVKCPIDFLSFHRKGQGTADGVLNGTLALLDSILEEFPDLAKLKVPIANDEADIMENWSRSYEWRADTRYAAMVVRVIALFYKHLILDRKVNIEVLSNDNGFLNYHPFYFTQRTLFARFQMNQTNPPHNQFIKKPVYSAMGLLSLLGHTYLSCQKNISHQFFTILCTKNLDQSSDSSSDYSSSVSVLIEYSKHDQVDTENLKTFKLGFRNLNATEQDTKFVVYLLDNVKTNPYELWKNFGGPVFPNRTLRNSMRKIEGPFRLYAPTTILEKKFRLNLKLSLPSIALIHICSKPSKIPGAVTQLKAFNITYNEVLLTWSDRQVGTKCIRTYVVEFESKCEKSLQFKRVNEDDTMFLSYHFSPEEGDRAASGVEVVTCPFERTIGRYRVRALDYWDRAGQYSEIISYTATEVEREREGHGPLN